MREVHFFHYFTGRSLWHRHDPRFKLLELALWSIAALTGAPALLVIIGIQLVVFHAMARSRIRRFRRPFLFWLAVALAMGVGSGLAEAQPPLIFFGWISPFGTQGLAHGLLKALRLLLMLTAGQLLASTTDPGDMAAAIRRIMFFLPNSWSGPLAMAAALCIGFIPCLLDEAASVSDAAVSRGIESRRSIFSRALCLGLPLSEATIRRAEITADAMISRCYRPDATPLPLTVRRWDWALIAGCVLPLAAYWVWI